MESAQWNATKKKQWDDLQARQDQLLQQCTTEPGQQHDPAPGQRGLARAAAGRAPNAAPAAQPPPAAPDTQWRRVPSPRRMPSPGAHDQQPIVVDDGSEPVSPEVHPPAMANGHSPAADVQRENLARATLMLRNAGLALTPEQQELVDWLQARYESRGEGPRAAPGGSGPPPRGDAAAPSACASPSASSSSAPATGSAPAPPAASSKADVIVVDVDAEDGEEVLTNGGKSEGA